MASKKMFMSKDKQIERINQKKVGIQENPLRRQKEATPLLQDSQLIPRQSLTGSGRVILSSIKICCRRWGGVIFSFLCKKNKQKPD